VTGMFTPLLDGQVLSTRVEMRIEKTTAEVVESASESPHPGQTWGSCTPADTTETPTPTSSSSSTEGG